MHFLTVPTEGTGRSRDGQSIVLLDTAAADGLWQAVRDGALPAWVLTDDADPLGDSVD